MPYSNFKPCQICGERVVGKGLCEKHYRRLKKHGDALYVKRPDDWGKRTKHPLNGTWHWIRCRTKEGCDPVWDDFWTFVKDVGERPSDKHVLRRLNVNAPFGPTNFHWMETKENVDRAEYAKEWRKNNPLKVKNAYLKKKFGIDLDEYNRLLELQNHACAICGKPDEFASLPVDHDHGTGRVRGLLCTYCNRGLGLFKDSKELLRRAIDYLERT